MPTFHRARPLLTALVLIVAGASLGGCNGWWGKDDKDQAGAPDEIYSQAAKDLKSGNYKGATEKLELLEAR